VIDPEMITRKDPPTPRGGTPGVGLETEMREITEIEGPITTSHLATEEEITNLVKAEAITEMKAVIATEVALIIGAVTEAQVTFTGLSEGNLHELKEGRLLGSTIRESL
jgi:hypothetical protein